MACPFWSTCLGLCEWTGCPGADTNLTTVTPTCTTATPTTTMHCASTYHTSGTAAGRSTGSSSCFAAFITNEQVAALSKVVTPANINKTTKCPRNQLLENGHTISLSLRLAAMFTLLCFSSCWVRPASVRRALGMYPTNQVGCIIFIAW